MGRPPKKSRANKPDSEAVQIERFRLHQTWATVAKWSLWPVGIAVCLLAAYPVSTALGGHETVLNIQVSLAIGITVTLAGVGAYMWGRQHKKRADRLDARNKELSRDVKELQARLKDSNLSAEVSR